MSTASRSTDAVTRAHRVTPRPAALTWYVAEHNLRRLKNYGSSVVATALGSPVLYVVAFGLGIGSLIDESFGSGIGGEVSYLAFVAPALVCATAIQVASEEFTYTIMMGFKWNPIYFGMNATPIGARQIVDGVLLFVTIRMSISCALYLGVMYAFGGIRSGWGVLIVVVAVLTGMAFGAPLMAYSATLRDDRGQFAFVMRFIVLPMTLFSGTMFPLATLPIGLQWVGWVSPLWHGTELSRQLSYGATEPVWLTVVHVAALVALVLIGWMLARRVVARRLDR